MLALSRAQLWSLVQATNREEIPLSIVNHWFVVYGKEISKKEAEELERDERRL